MPLRAACASAKSASRAAGALALDEAPAKLAASEMALATPRPSSPNSFASSRRSEDAVDRTRAKAVCRRRRNEVPRAPALHS